MTSRAAAGKVSRAAAYPHEFSPSAFTRLRPAPLELRVLGGIELRGGSREHTAVIAQPKRIALLSYLVLGAAGPGSFHRRDKLLGMFWPECDEECARHSLRQSVWFLRRHLGAGVVDSRGVSELRLAAGALVCDALAFGEAVEAGDWRRAQALYRGDLLEGFILPNGKAFDEWVERERARLRELATFSAWQVSADEEAAGRAESACAWARRAVQLAGDDEAAIRRQMALLDRCGDRIGAMQVYRNFVQRASAEYDLPPSAETVALAHAIRSRAGCIALDA